MGNCVKPVDPLIASIASVNRLDVSEIKESELPIIFLIGGPGSGKRTQCSQVAKHYGFLCVRSSDLLRDEVATGTERAVIVARLMSEHRLIPPRVMVELIKARMLSGLNNARGFLLSGFPGEKNQCEDFDKQVRPPDLVLYLCCRHSLMTDRILARTVTATERQQRSFDEVKRQIKDFVKRNKPILRHYGKKLVVIDGEKEQSDVFEDICNAIDEVLTKFPKASAVKATRLK